MEGGRLSRKGVVAKRTALLRTSMPQKGARWTVESQPFASLRRSLGGRHGDVAPVWEVGEDVGREGWIALCPQCPKHWASQTPTTSKTARSRFRGSQSFSVSACGRVHMCKTSNRNPRLVSSCLPKTHRHRELGRGGGLRSYEWVRWTYRKPSRNFKS